MKRSGARLGQHFLNNPTIARKLVEAAGITREDTVLEIGPGRGALTKELLKTRAHVVAVEKDAALVTPLRTMFEGLNLEVIGCDIRDFDPADHDLSAGSYILAANIPYYITGEIIRQFLTSDAQPKTMALLIQKEVAERILARDGKESILSISVKAYGTPSIAAKVSRGNFSPPPSVDSSILVVRNISKNFFVELDEKFFFTVVRAGFASKRKFLANNLGVVFGKEKTMEVLQVVGVGEKVRAEELGLGEWMKIATELRE
jgi:16S rRNA (adenine1518-N6/adenine1519-N6)-dimethyltransferase